MSERGFAWRRAARGINLIGFGIFLLLTTQGALPWSFWVDALRLWPVLLVALGLRLVVEKSLPWAVLVSPLLIQGTLAWVATHPQRLADSAVVFADSDWEGFQLARPEEAEDWTLDAELAFARLELAAGAGEGKLVEGQSAGSPQRSVWLAREGEHPRARLRGERHRSGIVWRDRIEAWRIRVSDELPLRVDLGLAFCEGRVDLGGLGLTRVDLEGAFNDLRVALPVPASETRVSLEGAFNDFEIEIPPGVPLRIEAEGFLNGVGGGSREGTGPGYRIDLEGAFNSLSVHSSEG